MSDTSEVAAKGELSKHRPALDGLRALAVIVVILYHLGIDVVPGGFLGVDAFFVLSGYLITSLLLAEFARAGRIDLAAFWGRRLRRLMPAALLLLLVVSVMVWIQGDVVSLAARRGELVAALAYYANWHFIATDQSYFATYTAASPLRHMWSLAIEEQFYVVWPAFVAGLLAWWRRGGRAALGWAIIAGVLASALAMAIVFDPLDPSRAYFGTDARAQELLVGAGLAWLFARWPRVRAHINVVTLFRWAWPVVAAGALLALLQLQDQSPKYYQGGALLFSLVVVAAIWIVEAAPHGAPARMLSWAPLVWIGRVSYGLYLWHWVIIAWVATPNDPTHWEQWRTLLLRVGLTAVAATASYYLVEQPIRKGRVPWLGVNLRRLAMIVPLAMLAVLGVTFAATSVDRDSIAFQVGDTSDNPCAVDEQSTPWGLRWCVRVTPETMESAVVAVIGDSTARALDPGMILVAEERGWGYIHTGQHGCSALPLVIATSASPASLEFGQLCASRSVVILDEVEQAHHPDVWVLSDRVAGGTSYQEAQPAVPGSPEWESALRQELERLLEKLTSTGAQVVIIETPPDGQPAECADTPELASCVNVRFTTQPTTTTELNRIRREVAAEFQDQVVVVSVDDVFCPDGQCVPARNGVLMRFDGVHLTRQFSRQLVPIIIERAEAAGIDFTATRKG